MTAELVWCLAMAASTNSDKLARRMAIKGGIKLSRAKMLEQQLTQILKEGLLNEGEVRIHGFGTLKIETRSAIAWDPKKKQRVPRRRKRAIKWKAGGKS